MALETANTINQLVETNPLGTDTKSQGDDHIRLIKKTLRNTFPNITGPITVSEAALNGLGNGRNLTMPGMIVMWSGVTPPLGWKFCDGVGVISTGHPVPDLRGQFIAGAGAGLSIGDTGGNITHSHTTTVSEVTLTSSHIPEHQHTIGIGNIMPDHIEGGGNISRTCSFVHGDRGGARSLIRTSMAGGGTEAAPTPHTHTVGLGYSESLPPYYALAFIIKE